MNSPACQPSCSTASRRWPRRCNSRARNCAPPSRAGRCGTTRIRRPTSRASINSQLSATPTTFSCRPADARAATSGCGCGPGARCAPTVRRKNISVIDTPPAPCYNAVAGAQASARLWLGTPNRSSDERPLRANDSGLASVRSEAHRWLASRRARVV